MPTPEIEQAAHLRDILRLRDQRLVLAESCTAGRIAATLAVLPGISQWLCGSFVVYRSASKSSWLGIPEHLLRDPAIGPVSGRVTKLLAASALERTPEAGVSLAITGDIGPGAHASTDGTVFLALEIRSHPVVHERQIRLTYPTPSGGLDIAARVRRLDEATLCALTFAVEQLSETNWKL